MEKNFDVFFSQLKETNATFDFYTDFKTVIQNTSKIEMQLNQLNYLLGKINIKKAIEELYSENKKCFEVLDILIAVRRKDKKKVMIDDSGKAYLIKDFFDTPDNIYKFLLETGLAEIFINKNIKNLVDYVFGVEVGLDTNGRKGRSGKKMANAVKEQFNKHNIPFRSEVKSTEFSDIESLGKDLKRFDFVIKTTKKTYLIETNFYNTQGSKPNEVARAYTDIAPKINKYNKYEFVWITDGQGWNPSKSKLQEAYSLIPSVYNLTTLENFISMIKEEM
ncbi:MAG: type II restriction endonuclease [Spirochaetaceae bacterium]|nr:type II restriction endonuclease [Spirochaetaceae bacterium]